MSKIIIIAGYTKNSYLKKIRTHFKESEYILACAYTRQSNSDIKKNYLELFDSTYDLTNPADKKRLKEDAESILLVTCTQERDMTAYIEAQLLCGKITDEQAHNYSTLIDKEFFKKSLQKKFPELVPDIHTVTPELLCDLESLTYPLVVKPSGLAGSALVKIVNNAAEFKFHYETFSGLMARFGDEIYHKKVSVVAEAYLSGPQYSMNLYVNAVGEVVFCPLVRVVTPGEFGIDDTYSALQYTTDELSAADLTNLHDSIKKIIAHFKVKNTSMHFDSVLHNGEWKFFEVGLRIGGNRQKLFELYNGMDHFMNDINNRIGKTITIAARERTACIVQKAATKHGTLKQIQYTRTIDELDSSIVTEDKISKIGKVTGPVSTGGGVITRHFVYGKVQDQVVLVSKRLFNEIKIEVA